MRLRLILVVLVLLLELVRRYFSFADCFVTLRYDARFVLLNPGSDIAEECFDRHVLFPFGFLL